MRSAQPEMLLTASHSVQEPAVTTRPGVTIQRAVVTNRWAVLRAFQRVGPSRLVRWVLWAGWTPEPTREVRSWLREGPR
jgi:hypothetical protein